MSTLSFDYYYGNESEQFIFYRIPKLLFTDERFSELSIEAKVLYGVMLDRMGLSAKNKWFDEQKRVYIVFTIEKMMSLLHCREQKANKLLKDLEEIGLIERKRNGLGKPNFIYVKNFLGFSKKNDDGTKKLQDEEQDSKEIQPETEYFSEQKQQNEQDLQQSQKQKCEKDNSRNAIFTTQDFPKSQSINTPLVNDTVSSDTVFNDTQKINQTVFMNNKKDTLSYLSYPYNRDKQLEPKRDEIDEIESISYSDIEKKEEKKEKPKQMFFIDEDLEEPMCNDNKISNYSHNVVEELEQKSKPMFSIDKGLQEQICEREKPKQRLFIDEGLKEQLRNSRGIHLHNAAEELEPKTKPMFTIDKGLEKQICKGTIQHNIEYHFLAENKGTKYHIPLIDNMVDIMVSVITSRKKTVRISGEEIPHEIVKERLLKLNSGHIEYVLECLNRVNNRIHNIRAYYLSALYHAPETMDAYYHAEYSCEKYA